MLPARFGRIPMPEYELRTVLAIGNDDVNVIVNACTLIVFFKPFAKAVCFDANDGILFGIKIGTATQSLKSNTVLLDLVRPALEVKAADVYKEIFEAGCLLEDART